MFIVLNFYLIYLVPINIGTSATELLVTSIGDNDDWSVNTHLLSPNL